MVTMAQSAANWLNTHSFTHTLTITWCEAPAQLLFFSACWVFSCLCNPPDSDMDYRIFNVRMWSFLCVRNVMSVLDPTAELSCHCSLRLCIWTWLCECLVPTATATKTPTRSQSQRHNVFLFKQTNIFPCIMFLYSRFICNFCHNFWGGQSENSS